MALLWYLKCSNWAVDIDQKHTSNTIERFFKQNKQKILGLRCESPYIIPIKHVFYPIKCSLQKSDPKNKEEVNKIATKHVGEAYLQQ